MPNFDSVINPSSSTGRKAFAELWVNKSMERAAVMVNPERTGNGPETAV